MFAGHFGAALAIGRAERRVNIGLFVIAALFLDLILWLFVLLGWETVSIPATLSGTSQIAFEFPFSHGLLAGIAWSLFAGAIGAFVFAPDKYSQWRTAVLIGLAVFSHWFLDALVHQPELPLAGLGSPKVGLGLWRHLPVGLALESAIVVAGLFLFLSGGNLSRGRLLGLTTLTLVTLVFTVAGMLFAPPPPSAFAMAASSLVTLVVVCALAGWFGRFSRNGK